MSDTSTDTARAEIVDLIESSRFVFGAMLVDDTPTIVHCVDHEAFDSEATADMTLATAVTSITSELIPIVIDVDEPAELNDIDDDGPRFTAFKAVADAIPTAPVYYLLVNTEGDSWKRVRHADGGQFTAETEITGPEDDRYRVASPLVDEARGWIADLPDSVDGTEIQPVFWS